MSFVLFLSEATSCPLPCFDQDIFSLDIWLLKFSPTFAEKFLNMTQLFIVLQTASF